MEGGWRSGSGGTCAPGVRRDKKKTPDPFLLLFLLLDFVFRHEDGAEVLFEIVGFWTPEYLSAKRETLRRFKRHRILLAVPQRSVRQQASIPDGVIVYKTALKLGPVVEALERFRGR